MNQVEFNKNIDILANYYEEVNIDNFVDYFVEVYKLCDTAQRLALVIHFMNNWFDADYIDIPRLIAEI